MKRGVLVALALVLLPLLALPALAVAVTATQPAGAACLSNATGGNSIVRVATGSMATGSVGAAVAATQAARAGFTGTDLMIAVAVAGAESSYDPTARNNIGASGLWQILQSAHPDLFARYDWRDPAQNAVMAYSVWRAAGGSWRPWTTWTSGAYLRYVPIARTAVADLGASSTGASTIPTVGAIGTPCAGISAIPAGATSGEAPAPYTGRATGCSVPDPSGTGGCVTGAMAWLMAQVEARFGHLPVACWSARVGDLYSDHPKGKACDYTFGKIGAYPGPADVARGWQLANWLRANQSSLHINYVIWQGRIWSRAHDAQGWRPYTGGGYYSTSGPTFGHYDHLHASCID